MISVSHAEPYILLVKDDQTIAILTMDESGDLEILEAGNATNTNTVLSGSLYDDANDILRLDFPEDEDISNVLMFLLTAAGGLHV